MHEVVCVFQTRMVDIELLCDVQQRTHKKCDGYSLSTSNLRPFVVHTDPIQPIYSVI